MMKQTFPEPFMLIAVPAETDPSECRVAATPETVKKLVVLGAEVRVETGAGLKSGLRDEDYSQAGAAIDRKPGQARAVFLNPGRRRKTARLADARRPSLQRLQAKPPNYSRIG